MWISNLFSIFHLVCAAASGLLFLTPNEIAFVDKAVLAAWFSACLGLLAFNNHQSRHLAGFLTALNAAGIVLLFAPQVERFLLAFFIGQWLLFLTIGTATAGGAKKRLIWAAVGILLPILAVLLSSTVQDPSTREMAVIIVGIVFAFVPLMNKSSSAGFLSQEWSLLIIQQTLLRMGAVAGAALFGGTTAPISREIWAYGILAAAVAVLIVATAKKESDFWERSYQTLVSLFVLGQTVFFDSSVFLMLLVLAAGVAVVSGAPSCQLGSEDRSGVILRPLENGGIGGGIFLVSLFAIYMNQQNQGETLTAAWYFIIAMAGGLSWLRNEPYSSVFSVYERGKRWIAAKAILHAILTAMILILGAKYV